MKLNGQGVTIGLIGVLLLAFAIIPRSFSPQLVVVDMTRAIQTPAVRLAHTKLSEAAQGKIIQRFTSLLPIVIEDYAKLHHLTVISAPILATHNYVDITPIVIEQTIQRLKHER